MNFKHRVKQVAKLILPVGSRRYRFVRSFAELLHFIQPISRDSKYTEWVERTEPYTWTTYQELNYQPKVSIIVPVFNPVESHFLAMVYSVVNQTYSNWELVLINASTKQKSRLETEKAEGIDDRIKVVNLQENKGIAGNTNEGIKHASGDYIALLDHDDILSPAALFEVIYAVQNMQDAGLIYSDEDKLSADGVERFDPHFKPDWSPHLLRELNYLNHFTVIKKELIDKIQGYRSGYDGAQDFDLYLRIADEKPKVVHVSKVLYHWRAAETSTANDFASKDNILDAGIKALKEHLARNNQEGLVKAIPKQPGFYKIQYTPKEKTKVAVVIFPSPVRDQYKSLVESISASTKKTESTVDIFSAPLYEQTDDIKRRIHSIKTVHKKAFLKEVLSTSDAEVCIVIDAAILPKSKTWVDDLCGLVQQANDIGAACPLIVTPDEHEMIVDAGSVSRDGKPQPLFLGCQQSAHTYAGNANWVRTIDYVSSRCFAMKRELLTEYVSSDRAKEYSVTGLSNYLTGRGLQTILWPFTVFDYRGELVPEVHNSKYLSPMLSTVHQEFSIAKTINVPPAGEGSFDE